MTSMRLRIFLVLILTTTLVWGGSVVWVQWQTRAEVQRVLDRRLMESARMVSSLIGEGQVAPVIRPPRPPSDLGYAYHLSCQIWTLGGDLVARSNSAPDQMLGSSDVGFSEQFIEGEAWRVYTVHVPDTPYRVMVGDSLAVRDGLVGSVVQGLLLPAVLGLLALGGLIWGALDRGLGPVRKMAAALARRDARTLEPLVMPPDATELHPIADAVNGLMSRVMDARRREAEFTAAAAHELRTPLAGIRLQAQVAASTTDAQARADALKHIQTSVDRTARLVSNLLALAHEDEAERVSDADRKWVRLEDLLVPYQGQERLQVIGGGRELWVDRARFDLVLSNLLANAATYADQVIRVAIEEGGASLALVVEDDGPGVPEAERSKLGQRFYRPARSKSQGSGLGLSIARSAVKAHGADMVFSKSAYGGLRVEIQGLELR